MKDFAALFNAVDQTTKTTVKTEALARYFETAPDDDRLWTITSEPLPFKPVWSIESGL